MTTPRLICPTCGKTWPDNYCPDCERTIDRTLNPQPAREQIAQLVPRPAAPSNAATSTVQVVEFSLKAKVLFLTAAWAAAALAAAIPHPGILAFAWMFPSALIWLVVPSDSRVDNEVFQLVLIGGWYVYSVLTILALFQGRRARFFVVYAILYALLA